MQNGTPGALGRSAYGPGPFIPRLLLLCAALLALPSFAASQPLPGWYRNSGASGTGSIIYEDSQWRITWENSYVYEGPGAANVYWYAQVRYLNKTNQPLPLTCNQLTDPSLDKEHIRGTEGIPPNGDGYVAAKKTFCSQDPNFNDNVYPGETHDSWAIFHNVPPAGEVAIEWGSGPHGRSAWVNPWYFPFPDSFPAPGDCPLELVNLGTCKQKSEPNVPHPGAYEIAQEITDLLKRLGVITPTEQPLSFVDGIIGTVCLGGTLRIGLPKGYAFEVKCITKLQEIAKSQCQPGDYTCFINSLIQHPDVILSLLSDVI